MTGPSGDGKTSRSWSEDVGDADVDDVDEERYRKE